MERTQASLYLYARAEEDGRKPRSGGAVRLALGSQGLDIAGCVNEAAVEKQSAIWRTNRLKPGRYLICFTPEAFLDLLGAFSSMVNARSVLDGVSLSNRFPRHLSGRSVLLPARQRSSSRSRRSRGL